MAPWQTAPPVDGGMAPAEPLPPPDLWGGFAHQIPPVDLQICETWVGASEVPLGATKASLGSPAVVLQYGFDQ